MAPSADGGAAPPTSPPSSPDGAHPLVRIHYLRPPDRMQVFEQRLLYEGPAGIVTFARRIQFSEPMRIGGRTVLEDGSDVVWFTFPGVWHDVGRFHDAGGAFTGLYANILSPPEIGRDHVWHTTDLFLDVWVSPDGEVRLLDEEQLDEALSEGWVDPPTGARAREEAARLVREARSGAWPPPLVESWTRERALAVLEAEPAT